MVETIETSHAQRTALGFSAALSGGGTPAQAVSDAVVEAIEAHPDFSDGDYFKMVGGVLTGDAALDFAPATVPQMQAGDPLAVMTGSSWKNYRTAEDVLSGSMITADVSTVGRLWKANVSGNFTIGTLDAGSSDIGTEGKLFLVCGSAPVLTDDGVNADFGVAGIPTFTANHIHILEFYVYSTTRFLFWDTGKKWAV